MNFKAFFEHFDKDLERLDILSYGISITTLEEVFLHINKELGVGFGNQNKTLEAKPKTDELDELIVTEKDPFVANSTIEFKGRANVNNSYQNISNSSIRFSKLLSDNEVQMPVTERLMNESTTWENVTALLHKRYHIYKRDRSGLACEVIVPFLMVILGSALTKLNFDKNSLSRVLSPTLYPSPQRILMNTENIFDAGNGNISPSVLFANLPGSTDNFQVTYSN